MSDEPPETVGVQVQLIGYEPLQRSGNLVALLTAVVTFSGGEEVRLQGMQIRRAPNGNVELKAPQFKSRDGRWRDAVQMPGPVMLAILDECRAEWFEAGRLSLTSEAPAVIFNAVAVSAGSKRRGSGRRSACLISRPWYSPSRCWPSSYTGLPDKRRAMSPPPEFF